MEYENDVKLPYVLFGGEEKTKGKQTIFQKGALGKTSKVKHFNHSAETQNYAIIFRYAVYKACSLHKGQLILQDHIGPHHQNGRTVTLKP